MFYQIHCAAPAETRAQRDRPEKRSARRVLLSFCLAGACAWKRTKTTTREDTAKTRSRALPNVYLDMRTIYSTLPAGTLSIGFSAPPLLSRLANLSSLRTPTSPSSQSLSVDLPLTVDVNDRLSVYGGVSGATSQAGTDPWTAFLDLRLYRSVSRPTSISRTAECFRPSPFNPTCRDRLRLSAGLDGLQHDRGGGLRAGCG